MHATGDVILGRYVLDSMLGRGAMGEVWKAHDQTDGEFVALKWMLTANEVRDAELLLRWEREAEVLGRLNHPNIVRLFGHTEELLIMEWLSGGSLRQRLQSPFRPEEALPLCLDLADALARVHRLGIIHRDLKPENILLAEDGSVRLSDFGIAHLRGQAPLTGEGALLGTLPYLSPEACQGQGADPSQDLWSLGVILYEMLEGRRPYEAPSAWELIQKIVAEPVPPLRRQHPPGWVDLLERLLSRQPEQRLRSARQLGAELELLQEVHLAPILASPRSGEEPPTVSLAHRLNLPDETTPWVGRGDELRRLQTALEQHREVTLLGPGGLGKSRLSREFAARSLADFGGLAFWVGLAPLNWPSQLAAAVAESLGIAFAGEFSQERQVGRHLNSLGSCLLILDNFEHLVEAAPQVSRWLSDCPGLKVLITSRRPLKLREEHLVVLGGLSPKEARELFQGCCQARGVILEEAQEPQVERIMCATQALPLALELAAGQLGYLSLAELADELEHSLELLDSGYVDADQRERGMASVFESSWERLLPAEQRQLAELSFFRGGFTREAAQQVTGARLPVLVSLCEHSLMRRLPSQRFEVHEQVRQLALRRLPDDSDLAARHAAWVAAWMDSLQNRIRTLDQPLDRSLKQIEEEQANLGLAWSWIRQHDRWDLWGGAWYGWLTFFDLCGRNHELENDYLRPLQGVAPGFQLARAINLNRLGQAPEGLALFESALAALDTPASQACRAYGLVQKALITQNREPEQAEPEQWVAEALPVLQQHRFATGLSLAYTALAVAAWTRRRDKTASQQLAVQALDQVGGNPHPTGRLNLHWAHLALAQGEVELARQHAQRGLKLAKHVHDYYYHAYAHLILGLASLLEGAENQAEELLRQALEESWSHRLSSVTLQALLGLAELCWRRGRPTPAARLLGPLERERLPWSARASYDSLCRQVTPQAGGLEQVITDLPSLLTA